MARFLLNRVIAAFIMLFVVATIVFSLLQIVPGDPAELLLTSGGTSASAEAIANLRERMGLNEPVFSQYYTFMTDAVQFDFGTSIIDNAPIAETIAQRLPRTLELILASTLIAIAVAIPSGTYAALNPGGTFDRVASGLNAVLTSVPVFVVGTLFIYIFAQILGILPAGGYIPPGQSLSGHVATLFLPALSVSFQLIAIIFRMTRGSVLEMRSHDWVRTATAKGLPRRIVVRRHILRNSLGPVITVIGLQLGILLGSTVLVEFVYNWPGLSGMLIGAVEQRDFPTVRAIILVVAALFITVNLIVEVINSLLDPRVRLS